MPPEIRMTESLGKSSHHEEVKCVCLSPFTGSCVQARHFPETGFVHSPSGASDALVCRYQVSHLSCDAWFCWAHDGRGLWLELFSEGFWNTAFKEDLLLRAAPPVLPEKVTPAFKCPQCNSGGSQPAKLVMFQSEREDRLASQHWSCLCWHS